MTKKKLTHVYVLINGNGIHKGTYQSHEEASDVANIIETNMVSGQIFECIKVWNLSYPEEPLLEEFEITDLDDVLIADV
jgi:hypothetical protein